MLQDVFENILLNSVKYDENSEIIITIEVSKIQINDKTYNKIEFIDNGIGVPDERKEIIFKRGNRELKGTKGMGLGLSLVSKIIESLNGKIWVENRIKDDYTKGSTFIITLPD
ncbi:MAG: sensor histidine kinase [Candidatus Hodarchaeota archaeon]